MISCIVIRAYLWTVIRPPILTNSSSMWLHLPEHPQPRCPDYFYNLGGPCKRWCWVCAVNCAVFGAWWRTIGWRPCPFPPRPALDIVLFRGLPWHYSNIEHTCIGPSGLEFHEFIEFLIGNPVQRLCRRKKGRWWCRGAWWWKGVWATDVVVSFALRMAPRELVESIQYEDIDEGFLTGSIRITDFGHVVLSKHSADFFPSLGTPAAYFAPEMLFGFASLKPNQTPGHWDVSYLNYCAPRGPTILASCLVDNEEAPSRIPSYIYIPLALYRKSLAKLWQRAAPTLVLNQRSWKSFGLTPTSYNPSLSPCIH